MQSLRISGVIITLNEEKNIQRCLSSISFCDEIIVVDSGSSDNTIEIAKQNGATVVSQAWLGFGPQKQFAVEQASNDWVLCLDADEVVSLELQSAITAIDFGNKSVRGYLMPRRNHFMGRALFHGEGYPDKSLRLFNQQFGRWRNEIVHEGVDVSGDILTLKGDLLHYSQESITAYLAKQNHYTELQAQTLFESKKRINRLKCVTSPIARFIKFYFLRLGFLDGFPGFVHIVIGCTNAFFKYAKLIELQTKGDRM